MEQVDSEQVGTPKHFVTSIYNVSVDCIQMALALTVALAWYAFVKNTIGKIWPDRGDKLWALGTFAIIISVIFAIIAYFIKHILKVPISERPITYFVGGFPAV